ncbi:hypothetical protein C8R47DRAFT_1216449 [Mycena vitilis]|nr:hypothetical protein C8R47DRAFT_1216449 [Mycena vitilis]
MRLVFNANFRVFESFGKPLGDKYDGLHRATGVGVIVRNYTLDLKRQVKYPDCLLTTVRISEVHPDRYFAITTMWSYQQQAAVAESKGYVVFFYYRKNEVARLPELGGVYAELHRDLSERSQRSSELHARRTADHPKAAKL